MSGSPTSTGSARTMAIIGIVLGVLGILFLPIILGPVAILLGFLAYRQGERLGVWAMVAGGAGLVIGMLLGAVLVSQG